MEYASMWPSSSPSKHAVLSLNSTRPSHRRRRRLRLELQLERLEDRQLLSGSASSSAVATASFIKQDTTTQGNWIGTYGSQGYDVIGNAASLPSYATVTPTGQASYTWAASSTDPRALQNASGSGRIAACWYSPSSFTVDVNLTDGQTHDLELYFLDWDSTARSEQVQISNASTGAVLNTETVTSFHSGVYLDWAVSGNVDITVTHQAGANAVLSGLFFDPPTTRATASFIKQDTTTQGNWIGTYGSQGYDVIGNAASLPSYATVTPTGQSSCTWAASTTDPRALQNASGSGRIAACWYSPSSFTVDVNLTDGQTHDLELYFLDWDSTARSEQVQISNASTGAVLDTETVTSFHSGVYLDWAVSGNVDITVTHQAGANAVLSGLFFDPPTSAFTVSAGSNLTTNAGSTVTFAGSVLGGTSPYTDSWSFGDGTTPAVNTLTPSHLYANPGTYTATLMATDSAGHSGSSSTTVTVTDVAPTVTFSDPTGTVGVPVSFTASATDISPAVQAAGFTYAWNYGDGTTGTGASTTHTYTSAGTYTVSVTATDMYGSTSHPATETMTVSNPTDGHPPDPDGHHVLRLAEYHIGKRDVQRSVWSVAVAQHESRSLHAGAGADDPSARGHALFPRRNL